MQYDDEKSALVKSILTHIVNSVVGRTILG
jgi:hypothetical protein